MTRTRIKVCCISTVDEARAAVALGADALGLVSKMPSGPGVVAEDLIAEIVAKVPPPVATFLLTSAVDADAIVDQALRLRPTTLQLVDDVPESAYESIRRRAPWVRIVQVIHVRGVESIARAKAVAPHVDALLLDSGNQALAVKELGGTGRTHDWTVSRRIVAESGRPVFLAGGLRPDNVGEAIRAVRPFGLDVCSGVRTDGRLDEGKLAAFARSVCGSAS